MKSNSYRRNSSAINFQNYNMTMTDPMEKEQILSTHYNQDCSCLAVSTNQGFKVYSLAHPTKVIKLYHNRNLGEVSLISMQFRTNIVAVVTRT